MMYYWPTLSALVGVGTNFFFIAIIVIFIWIRQIVHTSQYINVSALTESEQELVNEIRQSVQRSQAQKPLDTYSEGFRTDETSESENENLEVEDISPHGVVKDKPRGRMSAYAFFVQTFREEIKKKQPEEANPWSEFDRRCNDRWHTMTEKEKQRFQQMADNDKKRYESEMANYRPGLKKRTKDANVPKRPLPAFFWFSQDERPKVKESMPNASFGEVVNELIIRWDQVSADTRAKYGALAEEDKARYKREKQEYLGVEDSTKKNIVVSRTNEAGPSSRPEDPLTEEI